MLVDILPAKADPLQNGYWNKMLFIYNSEVFSLKCSPCKGE